MDFWQNHIPFFGAAAFCTTKMAILEDNLKNENDLKNGKRYLPPPLEVAAKKGLYLSPPKILSNTVPE